MIKRILCQLFGHRWEQLVCLRCTKPRDVMLIKFLIEGFDKFGVYIWLDGSHLDVFGLDKENVKAYHQWRDNFRCENPSFDYSLRHHYMDETIEHFEAKFALAKSLYLKNGFNTSMRRNFENLYGGTYDNSDV